MKRPRRSVEATLLTRSASFQDVIHRLEANGAGIVLIVDDDRRLLATVTDGDVRRAVLQGLPLTTPVPQLLEHLDPGPAGDAPVTAPMSTESTQLVTLMEQHAIRQVPLLDSQGRVGDLALLEELVGQSPLRAVVMAGGFGKRLHPLTADTPKPLLPVGDQPMLTRTVERLQSAGIRRISITTHFLAEQVEAALGDGSERGLSIDYVPEDRPLGTAGSLSLMPRPDEPTLVINGDVLTTLNFRAMLDFHQDYQATMTVAVTRFDVQVPYGVVESQGEDITALTEKPELRFLVAAGIYLLSPDVWDHLEDGQRCEMPDLIARLVAAGRRVVQFPISEYWLDIGSLENYRRAQEDVSQGLV